MKIPHFPQFIVLLITALILSACGTSQGGDTPVKFTMEPVGNQMEFATTDLTVEAGKQVTIIFENTATSEAMSHNVVVLNSSDEATITRVGAAGIQAGASAEYVPKDKAVLAYSPVAAPGETVEVTFTAPSEPGTYAYICTFPGHYMTMRGTLTVT